MQEFSQVSDVRLACMQSKDIDGKLVFTYKLIDGPAPYLHLYAFLSLLLVE